MIPVNEPLIAKNALTYVSECIKTGWVSSAGTYISKFEESFAKYLDVPYATTTSNGTSALHLALAALGIHKNDEVIVPDLTIISCAFAVVYVGAKPVFVDVTYPSGNMNPSNIEQKITERTRAIMVVHLYGHPVDMDPILQIAKQHKLAVIEDAAEAHGATYKGKKVGTIGDIGCFSFYGNKIVTTGEGGMVVTKNKGMYEKAKLLKDLAHSPNRRFLHQKLGYNFRMTNMQAALGCAQLEEIESYIAHKLWMAKTYFDLLGDIDLLELPSEVSWARSVWWMYAILLKKNSKINRDTLMRLLKDKGIDTRTYFIPLHEQPILKKLKLVASGSYPVSSDLSQRGLYLPSGLAITEKQITSVARCIREIFTNDTRA